ncbi:hypothetical protein HK101_011189 [Irineochytrium annulatum]|nr:hypothetical protein HK101_011189 [Irineochytrium annulatum]
MLRRPPTLLQLTRGDVEDLLERRRQLNQPPAAHAQPTPATHANPANADPSANAAGGITFADLDTETSFPPPPTRPPDQMMPVHYAPPPFVGGGSSGGMMMMGGPASSGVPGTMSMHGFGAMGMGIRRGGPMRGMAPHAGNGRRTPHMEDAGSPFLVGGAGVGRGAGMTRFPGRGTPAGVGAGVGVASAGLRRVQTGLPPPGSAGLRGRGNGGFIGNAMPRMRSELSEGRREMSGGEDEEEEDEDEDDDDGTDVGEGGNENLQQEPRAPENNSDEVEMEVEEDGDAAQDDPNRDEDHEDEEAIDEDTAAFRDIMSRTAGGPAAAESRAPRQGQWQGRGRGPPLATDEQLRAQMTRAVAGRPIELRASMTRAVTRRPADDDGDEDDDREAVEVIRDRRAAAAYQRSVAAVTMVGVVTASGDGVESRERAEVEASYQLGVEGMAPQRGAVGANGNVNGSSGGGHTNGNGVFSGGNALDDSSDPDTLTAGTLPGSTMLGVNLAPQFQRMAAERAAAAQLIARESTLGGLADAGVGSSSISAAGAASSSTASYRVPVSPLRGVAEIEESERRRREKSVRERIGLKR